MPRTAVDGHVHLHPGVSLASALDSAGRWFEAATGKRRGVLCLTESAGVDVFGRLAASSDAGAANGWRIEPTREPESLRCVASDGSAGEIHLLAGRQIVTAENLEVLALAGHVAVADGHPIGEVVEAVRDAGALPVVPWGFGKWWGKRGEVVRRLFDAADPAQLFAGDNGGRWLAAGRPRLFDRLAGQGFRILPGSDPFPLPGQPRRIGSAGFLLDGTPEPDRPAAWLRAALADPDLVPPAFGAGIGLLEFLQSQLRMQLRKRRRKAPS